MRAASLALALVIGACSAGASKTAEVRFMLGSRIVTVHAELADTETLRARGLMGSRSLPENAGMLFVWPDVGPRSFYMKDTLISLDLVAINNGRVVSIATMLPCAPSTDPCPITKTEPADRALEVNAGWADRAGVAVGTPLVVP